MRNYTYILLVCMLYLAMPSKAQTVASQKKFDFLADSLQIEHQLKEHNLPGFSFVVFEDYKIVYSKQYGVKSTEGEENLDGNTAFSTASISKPVTALLCFILEEKGLLDLDAPIAKSLKRWQLPKSEWTTKTQPSWKHFLNHTAGTTQHGFADFYAGDTVPTIKQSLLGQLPRYKEEINFLFEPGTSWQYSGGGYVVVQMALEDTFKTNLANLAQEHLFTPLGLENTSMIQPNEKGFLQNVALVHDKDGKVIKTGLPITPQVSASGLWSTPTDLAKLTIALQKALNGEDTTVISTSVAQEVTAVSALKNAVGGWSYGFQKSFGFNNYDWLSCNGSNTGVGGDVFATMTDGNGFVFLANGEKPNRFPVIDNTRKKLLKLLQWKKELDEDQIEEIPASTRKALIGEYNDFLYQLKLPTAISEEDGKLYVASAFFSHFKGEDKSELMYLGDGKYKIKDYPNYLQFNMEENQLKSVTLSRDLVSIAIEVTKK
ncbi:serine hydrolase domain-containing protein [Croceivirga sp. JEA036]|uniref:serine hydrolase domain-containing protein n=1 Tax=Croceivirga sp. JEA036 TaxID=2721162 RepID=UPI001439927C|nr:serine hydrolase domain-containing protein [Croceivirga sp. JEA036]NJB37398.1 beta-lactamase family protein [Croceivirga sp. JEA036]